MSIGVDTSELKVLERDVDLSSCLPPSVLAALPVALGDGVGAERGGSGVGLRPGAVPVGAHHPASLAKIGVILEAPQTSRPAS